MIHLDTNFLIQALQSGSPQARKLARWVERGETLVISTIAWTEFLCGPLSPLEISLADKIVEHSHDFTKEHAALAAHLFNETGRRRGSLQDCMIGAAAIAESAALTTSNTPDFARFEDFGLTLV